jgi:hypothetical protein
MSLLRTIVTEMEVIKRTLRRRYYMVLRPNYIEEQMKKRRGGCGRHGCCDLSFLHRIYNKYYRRCLSKDDRTRCLLWKNLPRECQVYPLDEKDKIPETRSYCNFYWEEEKSLSIDDEAGKK